MKTIQSFFLIFCFGLFMCTISVQAQNSNQYQTAMQKALDKLDSAKNPEQLLDSRNLFERISIKFNDQWQPIYYTAYCDIQMVYFDSKSEMNKARLENAKGLLEKLDNFANADASEVSTLWGYYYNAMIVFNPATSQTLFGNVVESYEKAIQLNPENPRPVILRAFFNQFLPSIVKLKIDTPTEVENAKKLFAGQEKSVDNPYWGEEFINYIKQ